MMVASLTATISLAVEAEGHGGRWKKPVVTVIPRLAVRSVSINNVAITSQSAKRWKRAAHTDHGEC
jgi:hypothetical protein